MKNQVLLPQELIWNVDASENAVDFLLEFS
jgi:hypothetical protein